ncbi:MAG: hypothetical protein KAI57_00175 [Candidatus Pacebacteria bacterium]|nr:hypothetical protein [Candidatus Paceibacterota bacterium]
MINHIGIISIVITIVVIILSIYYKNRNNKIWYDEEIGCRISFFSGKSYLLDKNGKRISDGYDKFYIEEGIIYGKLDSNTEALPNDDNYNRQSYHDYVDKLNRKEKMEDYAARIYLKDKGFNLENCGATKYVISDGRQISNNYHNLFVKDGLLYGQKANKIDVVMDSKGISKTKCEIDFEELSVPQKKLAISDCLYKWGCGLENPDTYNQRIIDKHGNLVAKTSYPLFMKNGILYVKNHAGSKPIIDNSEGILKS